VLGKYIEFIVWHIECLVDSLIMMRTTKMRVVQSGSESGKASRLTMTIEMDIEGLRPVIA